MNILYLLIVATIMIYIYTKTPNKDYFKSNTHKNALKRGTYENRVYENANFQNLENQCMLDPSDDESGDESFSVLCGTDTEMNKSSDIFNQIHDRIDMLMKHLNEKEKNEEISPRLSHMIMRLNERYGGAETFGEVSAECKSRDLLGNCTDPDTAYTINKGDLIAICLRKSPNGKVHDINTLMFVVIHELTHVAIDVYDHPKEFWESFKILLTESVRCCIYRPVDYNEFSVKYCGDKMIIEYNPLFDCTLHVGKHTGIYENSDIYKLTCCPN